MIGMVKIENVSQPDAGTISFSPFGIGRKLFLLKKEAQQYKTMLHRTKQAEFNLRGGTPNDSV